MAEKKYLKNADLKKVVEKYQPVMKKLGKDLGKAAKKGEESLVVMSKILKLQMEILGGAMQREKIYHEIGKQVADKLLKGTLEIKELDKYKSALMKIKKDEQKKKTAMNTAKSKSNKSGKAGKK